MPNHIHGIVLIGGKEGFNIDPSCKDVPEVDMPRKDVQLNVLTRETSGILSRFVQTNYGNEKLSQISPHKGTLSVVLRTYKAAFTMLCPEDGFQKFAWHGRLYDHIIRDGTDLDRIREYIIENPMNWTNVQNFPSNFQMEKIYEGIDGSAQLD